MLDIILTITEALFLVASTGIGDSDPRDIPQIRFNDENCTLAGEDVLVGSEDLALGKEGVLFITSGDLKVTLGFAGGSSSPNPGGIFALNMLGSPSSPIQLPLTNFPAGVRFQPHGIYVSNSSDRVLTTSHAGDHSRVEVFSIEYHPACLQSRPWTCPPATLHHLHSITSHLFPNFGINDVVEGASPQELYVTQWLALPYPTLWTLTWTLGIPWTRVFRCTWAEGVQGSQCQPVTSRRFYGANGITISQDRRTLFINDPMDKKITIMERQDDGGLEEAGYIDLPWVGDNIEMDGGEIIIGTIPEFENGAANIPVGLLVARLENGTWKADKDHILAHDGSKLAHVSAAARYGHKVVLGSPFSRGVLLCKTHFEIPITGLYKMESYDENFEKYLKAMGAPWFVIPLILASKETIRIKHSEDPETPWNFTTITSMRTTNRSIKFNEQSREPYGRGPWSGEFTKFCTRPVHNIVNCTILEKSKDWIISLEMEWTAGGMISTREFVNQHIVTRRFYQRVDEGEATIIETTSVRDTDDFEKMDWDNSFIKEEENVD